MAELIAEVRAAEVQLAEVRAAPARLTRPLPIGVFPLPFGYLLVPADESTALERADLLRGRLPEKWPPLLLGHELVLQGDIEGALAAFSGDDPVCRYNRFVLEPGSVDPERLRADLAELGVLVDLVEFTLGRIDEAPDAAEQRGEVAALLLAARAAASAESGQFGVAIELLEAAIAEVPPEFPALLGVLNGAIGQLYRLSGAFEPATAALARGIEILAGTDLSTACAEQYLALGIAWHERATEQNLPLVHAVQHYHSALQTITEEQAPEVFAAAHANLGSAYLTMPMVQASDQLRLGVAVGSLRAALRHYTRETHPPQWASAQLNLANALVYAPSAHQRDNLVEAVELYESVLAMRNRHDDPSGYARALANLGNALAHLGRFDDAWGKLVEARFLFEELHEYDAATSVRGVLDEIVRERKQPACAATESAVAP